jgi:preprotein translocase subunit YajC
VEKPGARNARRPLKPAHPLEDHGMLMASEAFAQGLFGGGGAAAPGGASNPNMTFLFQILQFLPLILIFYLLLIRPQQVQQKKLKKMLAELKKGDKVVTSGGIIGTIVGMDDHKTVLRIADDVKVEILKSAVVSVVTEGSSK